MSTNAKWIAALALVALAAAAVGAFALLGSSAEPASAARPTEPVNRQTGSFEGAAAMSAESSAAPPAPASAQAEATSSPPPTAEAADVVLASGRVVDERGGPVPGAQVELWEPGSALPRFASSGADGAFELRGPAGARELRLDVAARHHVQRTLDLAEPRTGLTVALKRYGVLSGRIDPPQAAPAIALRLGPPSARALPPERWAHLPLARPDPTTGAFLFPPVRPGVYSLLVARSGRGLEDVLLELSIAVEPGPTRPFVLDPLDLTPLFPTAAPGTPRGSRGG